MAQDLQRTSHEAYKLGRRTFGPFQNKPSDPAKAAPQLRVDKDETVTNLRRFLIQH